MSISIIVAGQAPLPEALLQQALQLTGPQKNCAYCQGKTPSEFIYSIADAIENTQGDLVILTEGMVSKFNEVVLMTLDKQKRKAAVITGMNLPLVEAALMLKDSFDSVSSFVEAVCAEGRSGISGTVI